MLYYNRIGARRVGCVAGQRSVQHPIYLKSMVRKSSPDINRLSDVKVVPEKQAINPDSVNGNRLNVRQFQSSIARRVRGQFITTTHAIKRGALVVAEQPPLE